MRNTIRSIISEFVEFLEDIGGTWVGLMSGIIGVCLWAFGAWVEPAPVSLRWSFLVLAAPAIIVACFLGWLKRRPQLTGDIDQTTLGQRPDDSASTGVFIIATIRNTGRPSVADEWTIYADLTTGRRVVGTKTFVGNSTLSRRHHRRRRIK